MNEPHPATVPTLERLTWMEICRRYPDEWVVLVETEWFDEDHFEFGTAVVLGHSKGHDDVLRKTRPLRENVMDSGIFFTGRARSLVPGALRT